MEREHPMDRLVCGDVGFGKTEVAMRAAFKAVQDGKQVAVLVPTTLLAQQHFQTFSERFAGYPVRVEVLSRFLTPPRPRRWSRAAHRRGRRRHRHPPAAVGGRRVQGPRPAGGRRGAALRRQPQGAIKQLQDRRRRAHLTATPIPRTLEMSLTGIRDLTPAQHAAGRPPADPHLRRRVRRPGRGRGHPARAAARGPGLLRAQPGAATSTRRPPSCASSCPRPGSRWPTARWTRAPSSRSCSTSGRASTTCSCAPPSSSRASTCPR
jgi:hypothetical protein